MSDIADPFQDPNEELSFFDASISEKSLKVNQAKKKAPAKRKAIHLDASTSISTAEIRDMQSGDPQHLLVKITVCFLASFIRKDRLRPSKEWIQLRLSLPSMRKCETSSSPLELGPHLNRFWQESVISYQASLSEEMPITPVRKSKKAKGSDVDAPIHEAYERFDDDFANGLEQEPEVFRAAPDFSVRSFDTPSQLPWHSHAGSTGSRASKASKRESLSFDDFQLGLEKRFEFFVYSHIQSYRIFPIA